MVPGNQGACQSETKKSLNQSGNPKIILARFEFDFTMRYLLPSLLSNRPQSNEFARAKDAVIFEKRSFRNDMRIIQVEPFWGVESKDTFTAARAEYGKR